MKERAKMILYTMVGIPAAGKSTFTSQHPECVVVSSDAIRKELFGSEECQANGGQVFAVVYDRIGKALADGHDVIFDATNTTPKARKSVFQYDAEQVAVFLNTPLDVCIERNAKRSRHVPQEVIERMAARLVPPTIAEGFDRVITL